MTRFMVKANMQKQEEKYIIDQMLTPGAYLLFADQKVGKSFFALGLALDIAWGRKTIGDRAVNQGATLYLAFEEDLNSIQWKLTKMHEMHISPFLDIAFSWPTMKEGGLSRIETWANTMYRPRLVVIDTFSHFETFDANQARGIYNYELQMISRINELARKYDICILMIHHTSKNENIKNRMNAFSGSRGLLAACTGGISMLRDDEKYLLFIVEHRYKEQFEIKAKFNTMKFRHEEIEGIDKDALKHAQRFFYQVIEDAGINGIDLRSLISSAEIATRTGEYHASLNSNTIKAQLRQMMQKGLLAKSPTNSSNYVLQDYQFGVSSEHIIEHQLTFDIPEQELKVAKAIDFDF